MVNKKTIIFVVISLFFLLFSFYPTIFELQRKDNLADKRREFVLEHNYYWPDYNLYLSKIRQGLESRSLAVEKYTSEPHQGSLIQEFYVALGWFGKIFQLSPNDSYLLGRIILSPLLLLIILKLIKYYFPVIQTRFVLARQTWFDRSFFWQIIAFLIVVTSASFPRIYQDAAGITHTGRFMEWWSNIDALQRLTFIPHILFGQVISFYLLYQLITHNSQLTTKKLILLIFLGNLAGLTFPPSLITLNTVLLLTLFFKTGGTKEGSQKSLKTPRGWQAGVATQAMPPPMVKESEKSGRTRKLIFLISTLPSLLYIFLITKFTPWSALVDFHRTHPMMIPFDQYILGTGPIFFLGLAGAILSIINRDRKFQPLIFWVLATFGFAAFFSVIKDQSPLRFTQTGLFIPLGILGTYFFYQIYKGVSLLSARGPLKKSYEIAMATFIIIISVYLIENLYMMKTSFDWQTTWISQRIGADIPPVPYPPQTMYPLREWMDAIRWLRDNTNHNDVVLAEITAGNHIPAYSGNFVYWGQSNTVDYNRKELEVDKFFKGLMSEREAQIFLANGRIKYIFFSIQEKEKLGEKGLETYYPYLKTVFKNSLVTIYIYSL